MAEKENLPTISIITPSYNQAKFLRQTIDSVLGQDYPHLEYVVMDGGSTDGSTDVLRSYGRGAGAAHGFETLSGYGQNAPKFFWESKKDGGQTDAINQGILKSRGEIIGYLNADDYYLPGTLRRIGEFFADHSEAMWVTGDYVIVDEHGTRIQEYVRWYKRALRMFPSFFTVAVANSIAQPSTFWRRGSMEAVRMFDDSLRYCMDYDFWLRLLKRYPLSILSESLSAFRIHRQSKGGSRFQEQFAEESVVLQRHTKNPAINSLHALHAALVVWAYSRIK